MLFRADSILPTSLLMSKTTMVQFMGLSSAWEILLPLIANIAHPFPWKIFTSRQSVFTTIIVTFTMARISLFAALTSPISHDTS